MSGSMITFAPLLSLNAQSANNTTGGTLDNTVPKPCHSLYVVSSAGVSAGVVTLEGSNDGGTTWFDTTATVTTNAASTAFAAALANFPLQMVRAKITTGITGGTVSAYVASA